MSTTPAPGSGSAPPTDSAAPTNGAAMAAFVAAGIGAFALGSAVLLHEAGIFSAPAIYAPAGGVSGRTTVGVLAWLSAWVLLHRSWRDRVIPTRRAVLLTLILTAAGVLATFPPLWHLF
jgi:protein-S-isoprenylcysteine O-methyltransferase Ste14